jgi:glyoxylase I family protein
MANVIHHTAVLVSDMERSLSFYRDGLGMEVTVEGEFDGPWRDLFDGPADRLAMTMVGSKGSPSAGTVELVQYPGHAPTPASVDGARAGMMLVSLYAKPDEVFERLATLGFTDYNRIELETEHGTLVMGSARDPDGTLVELIDPAVGAAVTG